MATAMRSLQVGSAVGHAAAVAEVSTSQPASLRGAWKGVGFKAGGFSASIPRRELKVRHAAPRSSFGPSGSGGGEGPFLRYQFWLLHRIRFSVTSSWLVHPRFSEFGLVGLVYMQLYVLRSLF